MSSSFTTAPSANALTPERLHARYAAKIGRHIYAVLGPDDEREDLVHDVLITIFRNIGSLRNPACLDRWVNQVTANTLRYTMRRRRLRRHAPWEDLPEREIPTVHTNLEATELASRVILLMNRLPSNDRALLTRYWFTPETACSIAAASGCSTITVRRRLLRARTRFLRLARQDPALWVQFQSARAWSRPRESVSLVCDAEDGTGGVEAVSTPSAA